MEFFVSTSSALELICTGAADDEAIAATGHNTVEDLVLSYLRQHRPWTPANASDTLRLQRSDKRKFLRLLIIYFDMQNESWQK